MSRNFSNSSTDILFDFAKSQGNATKVPFHIILEEAHRYVQNDTDRDIYGYNIFERITTYFFKLILITIQ